MKSERADRCQNKTLRMEHNEYHTTNKIRGNTLHFNEMPANLFLRLRMNTQSPCMHEKNAILGAFVVYWVLVY